MRDFLLRLPPAGAWIILGATFVAGLLVGGRAAAYVAGVRERFGTAADALRRARAGAATLVYVFLLGGIVMAGAGFLAWQRLRHG